MTAEQYVGIGLLALPGLSLLVARFFVKDDAAKIVLNIVGFMLFTVWVCVVAIALISGGIRW